jgi:hypothetical protein
MKKLFFGCCAACLIYAHAAEANPIWKAVPFHKGVFVDMTSITHVEVKDIPPCRCKGPAPPCHCRLPPADTRADIKVDGALAKGIEFWCRKNSGIEFGDLEFGTVGGPSHTIPTAATKLIVCGSS